MKMSGFAKGVSALAVAVFSYINNTYTPLIWVLAALIFLDLVMNMHKEGQQFQKIGSAAAALGIPGFITSQFGTPHFTQYIVALLTIAYIQVVFPQIGSLIDKIKFSSNPAQQQTAVSEAQDLATLIEQKVEAAVNAEKAKLSEQIRPAPTTQDTTDVQ